MAIVVRHTPVGLTTDQYDEAIRRLADAGLGHPPGRFFPVCFGEPGKGRLSTSTLRNLCPFSKTSASITILAA